MKLDFTKIIEIYKTHIEYASDLFTPEEYEYDYGKSDRYPSLMSVVARFLLKYLHFMILAIWVLTVIVGSFTELGFVKTLIVSPLATVIFLVLVALALLILMGMESFAKIISSLIQYGKMPKGAENPVDNWIMFLFNWNPKK